MTMENGTDSVKEELPEQGLKEISADNIPDVSLKPENEYSETNPEYVTLQTLQNLRSQQQYEQDPSEIETYAHPFNVGFDTLAQNNDPEVNIESSVDNIDTSSCDPDYKDDYSDSSSCEDNEDFQCKVCKQMFVDEFDLNIHFKSRRLGDKSYKCCGCSKVFRDNTQLNVHSRKHTGEQPYACHICGKKFSVNGNLSKHMRIHTGERKYECDTCERKFTQFAHLEDHLKTHSGYIFLISIYIYIMNTY